MEQENQILFIEPFYGGSHKLLIDTIRGNSTSTLVTLKAKKWHWKSRCGALMLSDLIPKITTEKVLFCSSVLNLAELLGIRPDLQHLKKIVYFHENQLIYPVREIKERDVQYAYNQIITCMAADLVLFNSNFNRTSFLSNIKKILKFLPESRPQSLNLEDKCTVLYFPVNFPKCLNITKSIEILHVLWPHRWEFDKNPDNFFKILYKLKENNRKFQLSILGESYQDNPPIFNEAKNYLKDEILNFGYIESKDEYFAILQRAHIVVSTAKHEFFGVAMLEATYCNCYPLAPNSLVYPEIYPTECLYDHLNQLYERLEQFCLHPETALEARQNLCIDFQKYDADFVVPQFKKLFDNQ